MPGNSNFNIANYNGIISCNNDKYIDTNDLTRKKGMNGLIRNKNDNDKKIKMLHSFILWRPVKGNINIH